MAKKEEPLKAYLNENFSVINQRLDNLSQRMGTIEKIISSDLDKIAKSFKKSMDKHTSMTDKQISIIKVFEKEAKVRTTKVVKAFDKLEKMVKGALDSWDKGLGQIANQLEKMLKEFEEEEK